MWCTQKENQIYAAAVIRDATKTLLSTGDNVLGIEVTRLQEKSRTQTTKETRVEKQSSSETTERKTQSRGEERGSCYFLLLRSFFLTKLQPETVLFRLPAGWWTQHFPEVLSAVSAAALRCTSVSVNMRPEMWRRSQTWLSFSRRHTTADNACI